jgi:uncharacterized protein (UPF0548 family)
LRRNIRFGIRATNLMSDGINWRARLVTLRARQANWIFEVGTHEGKLVVGFERLGPVCQLQEKR